MPPRAASPPPHCLLQCDDSTNYKDYYMDSGSGHVSASRYSIAIPQRDAPPPRPRHCLRCLWFSWRPYGRGVYGPKFYRPAPLGPLTFRPGLAHLSHLLPEPTRHSHFITTHNQCRSWFACILTYQVPPVLQVNSRIDLQNLWGQRTRWCQKIQKWLDHADFDPLPP